MGDKQCGEGMEVGSVATDKLLGKGWYEEGRGR